MTTLEILLTIVYLIAGFGSIEVGYYQTTSADWFGVDNAAGTTYNGLLTRSN